MVAQVQKPAPEFAGPAVVDGIITDISSKDFMGQWYVEVILAGLSGSVAHNILCQGRITILPDVSLLFYVEGDGLPRKEQKR